MSDSQNRLDDWLRELQPKALSQETRDAIERRLRGREGDRAPGRRRLRSTALARLAGLAACLAIAFGWQAWWISKHRTVVDAGEAPQTGVAAVQSSAELLEGFVPLYRYQRVVQAENGPVFLLSEGQPARNVYIRYMDTLILAKNDSSETIELATPGEMVRVLPLVAD